MHTGMRDKRYYLKMNGRSMVIIVRYSDVFPSGGDDYVPVDCRDITGRTESQALITENDARYRLNTSREVYDALKSAYGNATGDFDPPVQFYSDWVDAKDTLFPMRYIVAGRYGYHNVDRTHSGDMHGLQESSLFTGSRKACESVASQLRQAFAAGVKYGAGMHYQRTRDDGTLPERPAEKAGSNED